MICFLVSSFTTFSFCRCMSSGRVISYTLLSSFMIFSVLESALIKVHWESPLWVPLSLVRITIHCNSVALTLVKCKIAYRNITCSQLCTLSNQSPIDIWRGPKTYTDLTPKSMLCVGAQTLGSALIFVIEQESLRFSTERNDSKRRVI